MKFHSINLDINGLCTSRDKSYIRSGMTRHNYYCILSTEILDINDNCVTLRIGYIDKPEYCVNMRRKW